MVKPVILPKQGQSVQSCIIGEWRKKAGDKVAVGDILFSYETDKAAFEEEAKTGGTLLSVFYQAGDDVPCLSTVAVIGDPGEDYSQFAPMEKPEEKNIPAAVKGTDMIITPAAETSVSSGVFASPRAKAAAERMKVDINGISPSGPHGRIIERDVLEISHKNRMGAAEVCTAEKNTVAAQNLKYENDFSYVDISLTKIRKTIAANMQKSLSEMAQLTHHTSFDATAIIEFRKQLKTMEEIYGDIRITYNDIILYVVSRVLPRHPDLNAHYLEDRIRRFLHVNLGVAVDTPRGLMVPTLFNADTKSIFEIAAGVKELAAAAQNGSINPDLLQGGTFTVSNLGAFGIEMFTPVINPPQTGILGVDCIVERVRTVDSKITAYPAMGLSLTYDHRAVDGAPASRFLQDLTKALENFSALLILQGEILL